MTDLEIQAILNHLKEHASKVIILFETIPDDPTESGNFVMAKYGSHNDVLGLLEYAKFKTHHNMKKDFEANEESSDDEA